MMRITSLSLVSALALVCVSTSLRGQRPDDQIDPRSLALLTQGKEARGSGNLPTAVGLIESAIVVDPRNRQAFVVLAEIARQQELPGKAIRLYREALLLEPNDVAALRGQGEAMVAKGAIVKARENLAKLRTVCGAGCTAASELAATIAKGPPATATAQQQTAPVPTPGATPTTRQ